MKKTPTAIDTKGIATSKHAAKKATARLSKKTVLSIAPAETEIEHCNSTDEYPADVSLKVANGSLSANCLPQSGIPSIRILPQLAKSFSCSLLEIALQLRSWSSAKDPNASIQEMIESLLDDFEEIGNLTTGDGTAIVRLRSLLNKLHQGEFQVRERSASAIDDHATQVFSNAIHALIASLSQNVQMDVAVEKASQRAIYQFAYGLTHEINNPLANIVARAQQLIGTATSDSDRRSLATIVDQAMRAHEMLAEMMRVVQPRSIHPRIEDVVAIVRQAVAVQKKQWNHAQIQCTLRVSARPLYGSIDKASLIEAICSVLQNAMQVCRPHDHVEIICQEAESIDRNSADEQSDSRIRIAIRDTGPGLSPEAAERAWDLYHSGREHGRGLGISLANVRRTIQAHGGSVWIQSNPNAGCTIEIRLPKVQEPSTPRKAFTI